MLDKVFWTLTAIEGATAAILLIFALRVSPSNGDYSLGLYFTGMPLVTLSVTALVYYFTQSTRVHGALLVIPILMTYPYFAFAYGAYADSVELAAEREGSRIYENDPRMSALLKAISTLDEAKVRELAKTVDVNKVEPARWLFPAPYTPLRFAVERAVVAETRDEAAVARSRKMVELLLSLGAKPSPALLYACGSKGTELTQLLLDAGADPNYETIHLTFGERKTTRKLPFYGALENPASALGNLELLASHGARFELLDPPAPWPMRTAILNYRWDQVLFLYDHGLPMENDDAMRDVVDKAVSRAANRPDPQLARVRELMQAAANQNSSGAAK